MKPHTPHVASALPSHASRGCGDKPIQLAMLVHRSTPPAQLGEVDDDDDVFITISARD